MSNDVILRSLALVELVGEPIGVDTVTSMASLVGDPGDGGRIALQLAGLLRSLLESIGTDVEAWCEEYRARELADEIGGMA